MLFEFSLNYTKLAMLPIKGYVGNNKINSAKKKVTSSGDLIWDSRTLGHLLCYTLMPS